MKEYTVKKPPTLKGYPIHRAVAALASGAPHLWRDNGDSLLIRTGAAIDAEGSELPSVQLREMRLFNLRACVSSKIKGKHIYPRIGDHAARHGWLTRQAVRHGFEIVAVHSTSRFTRVVDQSGRDFKLDSTDFTGVLKVTDPHAFHNALCNGIGSTGRAFGFSLLSI